MERREHTWMPSGWVAWYFGTSFSTTGLSIKVLKMAFKKNYSLTSVSQAPFAQHESPPLAIASHIHICNYKQLIYFATNKCINCKHKDLSTYEILSIYICNNGIHQYGKIHHCKDTRVNEYDISLLKDIINSLNPYTKLM